MELLHAEADLKIWRIITPDAAVPARVVRYLMGSLGFDTYRTAVQDHAYWRLYYREALAGHSVPEVIDHLYLAESEGQFAARLWFAYSTRTGRGNFGNVFTEPEFRRRGLMNTLLQYCVEDFHASPARMLCCSSGNKYAVKSYCRQGFKLIFAGETGPLCLSKSDFYREAAEAYSSLGSLTLRQGVLADQFECDKFLFYLPEMYGQEHNRRTGPAARISDYRIAFQEMLSGNAVLKVAETGRGDIAGYAFAVREYNQNSMDFVVHPKTDNTGVAELLRSTAAEFFRQFQCQPLLFAKAGLPAREALAQAAGMVCIGGIPGEYTVYRFP